MPKIWLAGLAILLAVATAACYARVVTLPLVLDDWGLMARFESMPIDVLLRSFFSIGDQLLLRPGGLTFLLAEHSLFGAASVGYHLVSLAFHAANALLVTAVVHAITRDARVAWVTGFLYAGCTSIHLDTMIWAVGVYELGAMFFGLLCVLAFVRGRSVSSGLFFLLALSFKESVIGIPAILAAIALWLPESVARHKLRNWYPILIVFTGYILAKSRGVSPFGLPDEHSYAAALTGDHVFDNLLGYAVWSVQSLVPSDSPLGRGTTLALLCVAVAAVGFYLRHPLIEMSRRQSGPFSVFAVWAAAGLLPVLFLRHHAYRNFLSMSLPAILACLTLVGVALLESSRLSARGVRRLLAIGTVGLFALAGSHLQRVMDEGLGQRSLAWGTSRLVRRALLVDLARDAFREHLGGAPANAVVVLEGFDLVAIAGASGPRVWLAAPTLQVYDASALRRDNGVFHLLTDGSTGPIDRNRLYLLRWRDEQLEPLDADSWGR